MTVFELVIFLKKFFFSSFLQYKLEIENIKIEEKIIAKKMFVNPISPKKNPLAIISGVTGKEERQ